MDLRIVIVKVLNNYELFTFASLSIEIFCAKVAEKSVFVREIDNIFDVIKN